MKNSIESLDVFPLHSFSSISDGNPEVLFPYSQLNHNLRFIAIVAFDLANRTIQNQLPTLNLDAKVTHSSITNPILLFMRLVNRLHDKASELRCDQPAGKDLSQEERVAWEFNHYPHLIDAVKRQMVIEGFFNKFVVAVAKELNMKIPAGINSREYWEKNLAGNDKLKGITSLNLFNQGMRLLPPEISLLPNLKSLYLGCNQLEALPLEIASLTQLKLLDLSNNQFKKVPEALPLLQSLQHLKLNGNQLKELPSTIASLSNLEYLDLSQNPFEQWPSDTSSLAKLNYLYLNNAKLKRVPNALFLPPNLKELYLSSNDVTEISQAVVASLSGLRKCYLYHNPLNESTKERLSHLLRIAPKIDLKWDQEIVLPMGE